MLYYTPSSPQRAERKRKMKETMTIKNVPQWATTFLMYGDVSALGEEGDYATIIEWLDGLRRDGWRLVAPIFGTENEFCSRPEFGESCAAVDWTAARLLED